MAKITVEVPEHLKNIVEDRKDIDWDDIFSNCVLMILDVYPEKSSAFSASHHDFNRRN